MAVFSVRRREDRQVGREDGKLERVCERGMGHGKGICKRRVLEGGRKGAREQSKYGGRSNIVLLAGDSAGEGS